MRAYCTRLATPESEGRGPSGQGGSWRSDDSSDPVAARLIPVDLRCPGTPGCVPAPQDPPSAPRTPSPCQCSECPNRSRKMHVHKKIQHESRRVVESGPCSGTEGGRVGRGGNGARWYALAALVTARKAERSQPGVAAFWVPVSLESESSPAPLAAYGWQYAGTSSGLLGGGSNVSLANAHAISRASEAPTKMANRYRSSSRQDVGRIVNPPPASRQSGRVTGVWVVFWGRRCCR